MGLDMYLNKRTYVQQWEHQAPKEKYEVVVTKGGEAIRRHTGVLQRGKGARARSNVDDAWLAAFQQQWNQGFHAEPLDMLEAHFKINVLAAHWLTHALLPMLLKGRCRSPLVHECASP